MMSTYRSRYLKRGEVWFDNEPGPAIGSVDWVGYHQRSRPLPGARSRPFYTLLIDLTASQDELWGRLSRDTAYKIRRARDRDGITCTGCDPRDPSVRRCYEEMYNGFAAAKGLPVLDGDWFDGMVREGLLDLTVARDAQGQALVYHANYRDASRASELELPSLYRTLNDSAARNLIGRANRWLTWSDILRYKDQGLKGFDFGGWYFGSDPALQRINDFKRGFGGQVVCEYDCERILTLRGWLVLAVAAALRSARSVTAALRSGGRGKSPEPAAAEAQARPTGPLAEAEGGSMRPVGQTD
jgi:hypothetical protein